MRRVALLTSNRLRSGILRTENRELRTELQQQRRAASGNGLLLDGQQNCGRVLNGAAEAEPCGQRNAAGGLRWQVGEIERDQAKASAFQQQVGRAQDLLQTTLIFLFCVWKMNLAF